MQKQLKIISRHSYQQLSRVGGVGPGNRARTQPSKCEKLFDAKRQRKNWKGW